MSEQAPICVVCDGCGWCEGSPAFTCPQCGGEGLDREFYKPAPSPAAASGVPRRVPQQFSTGGDKHNAQKAWLDGYDAGCSSRSPLPAEAQEPWQFTREEQIELADWLSQAHLDYEQQAYRPSGHYMSLFLKAESMLRDAARHAPRG
jgi:hypothetical protein